VHDYELVHAGAWASTCAWQVCGAGVSAHRGRACGGAGEDVSRHMQMMDGCAGRHVGSMRA